MQRAAGTLRTCFVLGCQPAVWDRIRPMIHAAAPPEIAFGVTKICNSILANRNALPKLADHRGRQQGAGRMLYIVEIEANGDDLISQMNRFREWLDHFFGATVRVKQEATRGTRCASQQFVQSTTPPCFLPVA